MPGLHHAVARSLCGDGEPIQLAGETDREIADVDHLLHFAEAFGNDLAGLNGDEPAEIGLGRSQFQAEQADQFAALGCRHETPGSESVLRGSDGAVAGGRIGFTNLGDPFAGNRRRDDEAATRVGAVSNTETGEQVGGFLGKAGSGHRALSSAPPAGGTAGWAECP